MPDAKHIVFSQMSAGAGFTIWWLRADGSGQPERLFLEALEGDQALFGSAHPTTLLTMNNLANLYLAQGRHSDAEAPTQLLGEGLQLLALGLEVVGLGEMQMDRHERDVAGQRLRQLALDLAGRVDLQIQLRICFRNLGVATM